MDGKMKNAPIYFAIAQVRYNAILSLETYLSEIQEKFRKAGFPGFKRSVSMAFNLAPIADTEGTAEQIPPVQHGRYVFSNIESTAGFILEQNALSFQSTNYDTFSTFSAALLQGLDFLHKVVNLSFIERVGIRYLDAVVPRDGETLHQYLIPEVLGLHSKLEGKMVHSFSESMSRNHLAFLISRVIIQDGSLGFPPDLQPMGLHVPQQFAEIKGIHAVVDTDAFYDTREVFSSDGVKNHLSTLHNDIVKAFNVVVTEHALNVWK